MEISGLRAAAALVPGSRLASGAEWIAALGLAAVPLALGVGRFWILYLTPGDDIWVQYRSLALYPSDALVGLAVTAWLVSRAAGGRAPATPPSRSLAIGLAALALAAAASALSAVDPVLALGTAAHLAVLGLFLIVAADLAAARPALVVRAVCVAVVVQTAFALAQAVTQSTAPAGALFNGWSTEFAARDTAASVAALPGVDRWLRSYGTFPHPNIAGAFFAVTLTMLLTTPGSLTRWRAFALVIGAVGLGLTFSRASWLALALGGFTWVVALRGPRGGARWFAESVRSRPWVLVPIVLVVASALVTASRLARLDVPAEQLSFAQRELYDQAAWSMAARGVPVGAGNVVLAESLTPYGSLGEPAPDVFLIALAELGLPGIVAGVVLFGAPAWSVWRSRCDASGRAGAVTAAALLVPLLLFDHYLWTQPTGRTLLVLALALIATPLRPERRAM